MKKFIAYIKLYALKALLSSIGIDTIINYNKEYDFLSLRGNLWNCENGKDVDFGIAAHWNEPNWDSWASYANPYSLDWETALATD